MAKGPTDPLGNLAKGFVGKRIKGGISNLNPLQFVGECARVYSETQREITERCKIEAEKERELADIEAKRQVFLAYLEKAFSERAENFRRLFDVVDSAIENKDTEQLGIAVNGILELAKTTPFKDLVDANRTKELLSKEGHEWKF